MRKILITFAGLALAFLAGCSGLPQQQVSAAKPDISHIKCESQQQAGCWELRGLNMKWDEKNPIMSGLVNPPSSEADRQARTQFLAPKLWEEYRAGTVQASKPRSILVYMWNVVTVPAGHVAAYRVNGQNVVTKVSVEDVTDKVIGYMATATDGKKLGAPEKAYRLTMVGDAAVGASVQFPWTMVTDSTYLMVKSEDGLAVYPSASLGHGLWGAPVSLKWLRIERKSTRGLVVVLSRDG